LTNSFTRRARPTAFPNPTPSSSVKTIHRVFHNAFGNIHIAIDDLIVEGDKVAIRWTCTMVHNGEALGFPATGKNVAFPGSSFIHCRDGQLTDGWNFMDLTKMTQQLQSS
jgi:predicted ester cyclase